MILGKKILGILILFIFVCTICFAGGQDESSTTDQKAVKLSAFLNYSKENEVTVNYALGKLKVLMPNVAIEINPTGSDRDRKVLAWASAGSLPDIFEVKMGIINILKESRQILILNEWIDELGIKDRVLDAAQEILYHPDGNVYAMPTVGNRVGLFYYNKEILSNIGMDTIKNYPQMLSAVQKINENGITPLSVAVKPALHHPALFFEMLVTRYDPRGYMALDSGEASITDDAYVNSANKFVELIRAGLINDNMFIYSVADALALFKAEQAAFYASGAWRIPLFEEALGDKVDIMPYPFADPGMEDDVEWVFAGGRNSGSFSANADSPNKDIVAQATIWLAYYKAEGRVVKYGESTALAKDTPPPEIPYGPLSLKYIDGIQHWKSYTTFAFNLDVELFTNLNEHINRLYTGDYEAADFINDLDQILD